MLGIRKEDKVMVLTGKDKGKSGRVIKVWPKEAKALIEGINIVKKAVRKSDKNPNGGVVELERPIHVSNLMVLDKKLNKPTRIGTKLLKDGSKIRIGRKTGEAL